MHPEYESSARSSPPNLRVPSQVVSPRNGGEEAPCPFCAKPAYAVSFAGPKTAEERAADARDAARLAEQQRLMREVPARFNSLTLSSLLATSSWLLAARSRCC